MKISYWSQLEEHIQDLQAEGLITATFQRLEAERRNAVLDAVLAEAVERGPTTINIKHVAKKADVAIGSLYQYFGNRDNLVEFAVQLCIRYLVDEFKSFQPYLLKMTIRDGLAAYLTGGLEWSRMQVGLKQFFLKAAYQGDPNMAEKLVRPLGTVMLDTVRQMLLAAQQRGEVRQDVNLEVSARTINAMMIAVGDSLLLPYLNIYTQVFDSKVQVDQLTQALVDNLLDGIGPSS